MSVLPTGIAAPTGGYEISRSVRLRSSASAYFNRTPASAGSRTTWTLSMWLKRGAFSASNSSDLFTINNGTTDATYFVIAIRETDKLRIEGYNTIFRETTQVLRDVSAWYHLVVTADTTNGTAGNRIKMYLNGAEITAFSTSNNPTSSQSLGVNQAATHKLGSLTSTYFDGYLTEINFIDGQALTPSSFGETDTITGVWKPKRYAGTYGTNGFYLNFSDNSNNTAATIGADSSGNGNNWTPNNISVTSGVTYDSMLDVPTMYADGGNGRGNYPVVNPLNADTSGLGTSLTWGNLRVTGTTYAATAFSCTFQVPQSGKWYYEVVYSALTSAAYVGIRSYSTGSTDVQYASNGNKSVGGSITSYGASWTTGNVIGIAVDRDAGTVTFYKNNTSQGAISIPTNSAAFDMAFNSAAPYGSASFDVNFGQRPFAHTPPTGFNALNTQNLPDATIKKGNAYFDATLYTGNGSSQTITGVGFQPDLLWIKERSSTSSHCLWNSVVGVSKYLSSDGTSAEYTTTTELSSINSDGFSVGSSGATNQSSQTYVAWQWKAGGSAVSNTDGSITSSVSAGASQGFSVVTWTEPTSGSVTVGHGLGVAPKMVIAKARTLATNWSVWHTAFTSSQYILLNSTAAVATSTNRWNNTLPTSTVFSAGSDFSDPSSPTMVAYCFAEVAGYSKFGSYTGNGSTDGVFVYLGFRPRFVMVKRTDTTGNWFVWDTARETFNVMGNYLLPNSSAAEPTGEVILDALSNGFKMRSVATGVNGSGGTYIYAAFAENPAKYSLAR